MKLRESLGLLLSPESCLTIEDVLPLLPPKTKMREIKRYLAKRVNERIGEINGLKASIEEKSEVIAKLQESKKLKAKSHILIDPTQQCYLCH